MRHGPSPCCSLGSVSVPENRLPLNTQVALFGAGLTQLGIGIGETFILFFFLFSFLARASFLFAFLALFFSPVLPLINPQRESFCLLSTI